MLSLKELAELLVEVNGAGSFACMPFPEDRKPIDIGDYFADFSKIERDLGWSPRVGLRDGITESLSYYRRNGNDYWDTR